MRENPGVRASTASLLAEAMGRTSRLIGAEIQLVRLELAEKVAVAVKAIIAIVSAAIVLLIALIFLLQGLVALIVGFGLSVANANFAVGGGVAVAALIAIVIAARSLSGSRLKPKRALRQIQENADLMKSELAKEGAR